VLFIHREGEAGLGECLKIEQAGCKRDIFPAPLRHHDADRVHVPSGCSSHAQPTELPIIEAHLAIICASAPALKALFKSRVSHQLSNMHASIRSNSFRHRSSRAYRTNSGHHADSKKQPHARSHSGDADEGDIESLSLQSYNHDKPLASRDVHIAELQRLDQNRNSIWHDVKYKLGR
jgi:hypothetical protein